MKILKNIDSKKKGLIAGFLGLLVVVGVFGGFYVFKRVEKGDTISTIISDKIGNNTDDSDDDIKKNLNKRIRYYRYFSEKQDSDFYFSSSYALAIVISCFITTSMIVIFIKKGKLDNAISFFAKKKNLELKKNKMENQEERKENQLEIQEEKSDIIKPEEEINNEVNNKIDNELNINAKPLLLNDKIISNNKEHINDDNNSIKKVICSCPWQIVLVIICYTLSYFVFFPVLYFFLAVLRAISSFSCIKYLKKLISGKQLLITILSFFLGLIISFLLGIGCLKLGAIAKIKEPNYTDEETEDNEDGDEKNQIEGDREDEKSIKQVEKPNEFDIVEDEIHT